MGKQRMTNGAGTSDRCFRGEILRGDGADEPDAAEQGKQQKRTPDRTGIAFADAVIDEIGNDKRYEQLEGRLQKLKQRTKNRFLDVRLQKRQQFLQKNASSWRISQVSRPIVYHIRLAKTRPHGRRNADFV